MDSATFESFVVEALDTLPPEFAQYLTNIAIQIADQPTPAQLQAVDLPAWKTLYGLYQGVPLTARSGGAPFVPDIITLFQGPMERDFPEPAQLKAQVRHTLLHEIAHFFGISDHRLRELNAY